MKLNKQVISQGVLLGSISVDMKRRKQDCTEREVLMKISVDLLWSSDAGMLLQSCFELEQEGWDFLSPC